METASERRRESTGLSDFGGAPEPLPWLGSCSRSPVTPWNPAQGSLAWAQVWRKGVEPLASEACLGSDFQESYQVMKSQLPTSPKPGKALPLPSPMASPALPHLGCVSLGGFAPSLGGEVMLLLLLPSRGRGWRGAGKQPSKL